jgi:hypothetical protein
MSTYGYRLARRPAGGGGRHGGQYPGVAAPNGAVRGARNPYVAR